MGLLHALSVWLFALVQKQLVYHNLNNIGSTVILPRVIHEVL